MDAPIHAYADKAAQMRMFTVEKRCPTCGEVKPPSAYSKSRRLKSGMASNCRECDRWKRIREKWGLTREQWHALWEEQDGKCALCRTDKFGKYGPHVDHDHETGIVRGILCHSCNVELGSYEKLLSHATHEEIDAYVARGRA